jgi:hypothetical protein
MDMGAITASETSALSGLQGITPQNTAFSLRNVFVSVKINASKAVRKQIHLQFILKFLLEAIKKAKVVNNIKFLSRAHNCWVFCGPLKVTFSI